MESIAKIRFHNWNNIPERVTGRSYFKFNKTFSEDATIAQVYNNIPKQIFDGVMNGYNGIIYAYSQSKSGKTFTLHRSDENNQARDNKDGIIKMAARDIFLRISQDTDITFADIYDKIVRDLLLFF